MRGVLHGDTDYDGLRLAAELRRAMVEPDNMVLRLLQDMRADMSAMRAEMATKTDIADVRSELGSEIADLRSEVRSLRADVASDLVSLEKGLGDQIATLRRAVMEYHSSTIGHGILYSEIEERVRRIEQHLKLEAPGAH
jgi:hypothetical protein